MSAVYTLEEQAANRRTWVAALRSGGFVQSKYGLCSGAGFCCLGVACEVSRLGSWEELPPIWRRTHLRRYITQGGTHIDILPRSVQDWLGLRTNDGEYFEGTLHRNLSTDNDMRDMSFLDIAAIIESEPEGLIVTREK